MLEVSQAKITPFGLLALKFKAAASLSLVRVALAIFPFRTVLMLVAAHVKFKTNKMVQKSDWLTPNLIASCINSAAGRVPGEHSCLPRAFACQLLLSDYGYESSLQIGVAPGKDTAIKAHAWVEVDGCVIMGDLDDLADYRPFPSGARDKQ